MGLRRWALSLSLMSVVVVVWAFSGAGSRAFCQDSINLSKWSSSSSREAGTRQTLKVGETTFGLVWIPAGEVVLKSPTMESARWNEDQQVQVKIKRGFWMLETQVSQELYDEVMKKKSSEVPKTDRQKRVEKAAEKLRKDRSGNYLPVEHVAWEEATEFCAALTKRLPGGLTAKLPTEAQWEYARAAKGADSSDERSNSGPTNAWGLYGMEKDAKEWIRDAYAKRLLTRFEEIENEANAPPRANTYAEQYRRGAAMGIATLQARSRRTLETPLGFRFRFVVTRD